MSFVTLYAEAMFDHHILDDLDRVLRPPSNERLLHMLSTSLLAHAISLRSYSDHLTPTRVPWPDVCGALGDSQAAYRPMHLATSLPDAFGQAQMTPHTTALLQLAIAQMLDNAFREWLVSGGPTETFVRLGGRPRLHDDVQGWEVRLTNRRSPVRTQGEWPTRRRGLGLKIAAACVEELGGHVIETSDDQADDFVSAFWLPAHLFFTKEAR